MEDRDKEQLINKTIKSEELNNLIVENTTDVVTLNTFTLNPVFIYINPSIKINTGYEPEELLGKSPFEFIHPEDKKKLLQILKDYVNAKIKKFFTGKESPTTERIEFRFKDKKGNWRYVQSTGNIVGNHLLFITRDITESKKAEEKLRESEEKYRHLFENMPGVYYRINREGTLIMINPAGAKMFGYEHTGDMLGKNVAQNFYLDPEERKGYLKRLEKNKGTLKEIELIFKKKNGDPLIVSDTSHNYYDKDENIAGVEGNFLDITERKKAEKALQKSQEEFTSLFKSNPEALVYLDKKGIILDTNLRFCKLFGYSLKEIKGRNIDDGMIHTLDKIKEGKKLSVKGLKGYLNYETIRKKKDGTLFPVSRRRI